MIPNILKILTFAFVLLPQHVTSQEIWSEHFEVPGKGIWANENGVLQSDFLNITKWNLNYNNIQLVNEDDYAKTVSTGGGRFECRDINGEIIWLSEKINISGYDWVTLKLTASETGTGDNHQNKYLKAFYAIDGGPEILLKEGGINSGNWGDVNAKHDSISGQDLQIFVYMNNYYASDKVILDEVVVSGFSQPVPISKNDLLINEVLFNPVDGGADFVEIYNFSEKEIPINQLYLASREKNFELTQIYPVSAQRKILYPNEYLALTKDTNGVFPWFFIRCRECFAQMEKFPSFNNDEDYVVLLNEKLEIIDELFYTEKMHSPVFYDVDGVSLERVSFILSTNIAHNWQSASSESGYGTPGYKNSQAKNNDDTFSEVTFSPESFSPNYDGYNDEFLISYKLEQPGTVCNVKIFDQGGSFVFQLAKNQLLGTEGKLTWNGKDETGRPLPAGVYIFLVEIFDYQGKVRNYKNATVLTDVWE